MPDRNPRISMVRVDRDLVKKLWSLEPRERLRLAFLSTSSEQRKP
jgi:hypothetical protein